MRIQTERLVLAPYSVNDLADMCALRSDPEIIRDNGGSPPTREQIWVRLLKFVGHWSALNYGVWTLRDRHTRVFVGEVGFSDHKRDLALNFDGYPEMGWSLMAHSRGNGFASEAGEAALRWADEHLGRRTVCMIDPLNAPSLNLASRFGFKEFGQAEYEGQPVYLFERNS